MRHGYVKERGGVTECAFRREVDEREVGTYADQRNNGYGFEREGVL